MSIQEAIQKAIQEGYDNQVAIDVLDDFNKAETLTVYDYGAILLDPSFWQALGKSMKKDPNIKLKVTNPISEEEIEWEIWRYYWHSLIDHLSEGGDIETFFKNLS